MGKILENHLQPEAVYADKVRKSAGFYDEDTNGMESVHKPISSSLMEVSAYNVKQQPIATNNNGKRTISSIERRDNYNDDLKLEVGLVSRNRLTLAKELKQNTQPHEALMGNVLNQPEDQTNMFDYSKIYADTSSIPTQNYNQTITAR